MLRRNEFDKAAGGETDAMMMIAVQWRAGRNQFQVNLQPSKDILEEPRLTAMENEEYGQRGVWSFVYMGKGPKEACIMAFNRAMRCIRYSHTCWMLDMGYQPKVRTIYKGTTNDITNMS